MMSDELNQFEERLSRQAIKRVPGDWRAEIVAAARAETKREVSHELTFTATGRGGWLAMVSRLIWPHPRAWAGLAAVWVFIFMLNFSMREQAPVMAAKTSARSPEVMAELRQEHKMLAELIGAADRVADRQPMLAPKPRSERAEIMAV